MKFGYERILKAGTKYYLRLNRTLDGKYWLGEPYVDALSYKLLPKSKPWQSEIMVVTPKIDITYEIYKQYTLCV